MINSIPKFDVTDYVKWFLYRYIDLFLSKIVSGLENHVPILRSREDDPVEGSD